MSVLQLRLSSRRFEPGFSEHQTKAWIPLALQLGAEAPTLPSFLLFSSSGDVEQLGLTLPCSRAPSRTALTGASWPQPFPTQSALRISSTPGVLCFFPGLSMYWKPLVKLSSQRNAMKLLSTGKFFVFKKQTKEEAAWNKVLGTIHRAELRVAIAVPALEISVSNVTG